MLRLNRPRKFKIPNRLAILAAFILVASSAVNPGHSSSSISEPVNRITSQTVTAGESAPVKSPGKNVVRKSKGLKMSLLLFRRS